MLVDEPGEFFLRRRQVEEILVHEPQESFPDDA